MGGEDRGEMGGRGSRGVGGEERGEMWGEILGEGERREVRCGGKGRLGGER